MAGAHVQQGLRWRLDRYVAKKSPPNVNYDGQQARGFSVRAYSTAGKALLTVQAWTCALKATTGTFIPGFGQIFASYR